MYGKSQLQEIRLVAKWRTAMTQRVPTFNCKWYSKKQRELDDLNIEGEVYQPSAADVGSVIYVQAVPECKDLEYVGMPITKEIGPILMDEETIQQATEMLEAGKATFLVDFTQLNTVSNGQMYTESVYNGLIKIVGRELFVNVRTSGRLEEVGSC